MTIEIQYAFHTPDLGQHVCPGGFAEAVEFGSREDEIWVYADGEPLMALPPTFNRFVAHENGEEIRSAVLFYRELMPFDNEPPLPPRAPRLTIDHLMDHVVWVLPGGSPSGAILMRILYDKGGTVS